jgi:hypothetical protein
VAHAHELCMKDRHLDQDPKHEIYYIDGNMIRYLIPARQNIESPRSLDYSIQGWL